MTKIITIETDQSQLQAPNLSNLGVLVAISNVQKSIVENGGIGKEQSTDSTNKKFQYKYRGIDDMYNAISPLMHINNLICIPKVLKAVTEEFLTATNGVTYKTVMAVEYTFLCSTDGSSFSTVIMGEANDPGDKGYSKALSMAQKYLYIQVFSIPTNTDHDPDKYPSDVAMKASPPAYNPDELATLQAKNEADQWLRRNTGYPLIDFIKTGGFNFESLTIGELNHIAERAAQRLEKLKQEQQNQQAQLNNQGQRQQLQHSGQQGYQGGYNNIRG